MTTERLRPGSLNLLRTFEAAARLGGFKAAAAELCVTPAAVSQQVRALEDQLGAALFERHARGLALTATGREFLAQIQPHLAALAQATQRLRAQQRRQLRVSLMPPLASRVVLPHLADFQAAHPEVELRIDTRIETVDLQKRQVDLAVRYGTPPWPGCAHERLIDLQVQAVCPRAIAEKLQLATHPENLVRAPRVHMTGRPDAWRQYFALLGLVPQDAPAFHVDDYPAAIEAASTLGAALAVMPLEKPLLDSGAMVAAGPALGPLPEAVHAVMLADRQADPAIRAFIVWLNERLQALGKA